MSDTVKAWIEERRAIHAESTDGPWVAEYSAETGDCVIPHDAQSTREAVAVTRLFHQTADANAIADAHNMFPRAMGALNAVLELHRRAVDIFEPLEFCAACSTNQRTVEWPCPTVQAVQAAIAGGR